MSARRIGGHLSVAGGFAQGLKRAAAIGANTLQIFSGSPRVWARRPLSSLSEELTAFAAAADEQDIRPIFVHSIYLLNLASENKELVQKSKKMLIYDLKFGSVFAGAGVVVHLGSHQGRGWEVVREQVRVLIQECIDEAEVATPFLIENSAGQKGKLGSDLREIRWLLDGVDRRQLGWCYDTCHGWAAGYDHEKLWATLDELHLWKSLRCVHANDSRDPFASGRDRHDNIGDGTLPRREWRALLGQEKWAGVPLITEAPGLDGNGPDAENIRRLQALCA